MTILEAVFLILFIAALLYFTNRDLAETERKNAELKDWSKR